MDEKWYFLAVITAIIMYGGYEISDTYVYKSKAIEAGLEECPKDPKNSFNSSTIFVKSCKEYMTEYYIHNPWEGK